MNLSGICIITENVTRLSKFYSKVLQASAVGNEEHISIETDGAGLAIFSKAGMEKLSAGSSKYTGNSSHILMFEVDDTDAEYERLIKMNIEIVMPPTTFPWGSRAVWFKDPDGNIVDFYSKTKI